MTEHPTTRKLRSVLASAVVLTLLRNGQIESGLTRDEREDRIARATLSTLNEHGLGLDDAPGVEDVQTEIDRRGGWNPGITTVPLLYGAACLQCESPVPQRFPSNGERKMYLRQHTEKTGHQVISRWEQPSTFG